MRLQEQQLAVCLSSRRTTCEQHTQQCLPAMQEALLGPAAAAQQQHQEMQL
jgi:hypothetical protein